jgi:hypothetical protein
MKAKVMLTEAVATITTVSVSLATSQRLEQRIGNP